MATSKLDTEIDWGATTWEGSRRAQLRGWCALTLRERLEALEGMADISRHFADMRAQGKFTDLSQPPEDSKRRMRSRHHSTGVQ